MKDKIIETVGKTWRALGEKGETSLTQLPKILNEKDELVWQALGWLAREDKINYSTKNDKTFVSLVEPELKAFASMIKKAPATATDPKEKSLKRWIR